MSRLSDLSIPDDIKRVELYRQLLQYMANNPDDVLSVEVKQDERYRVDLLSQRAYRTPELDWLVMLCCAMDDSLAGLPVGYTIMLPPLSEVRRLIREVRDAS